MRRNLFFSCLCLLGAMLLWSCDTKKGEETRSTGPTEPRQFVLKLVQDTTFMPEARVGPGFPVNDSIRATGEVLRLSGLGALTVEFENCEIVYGPDDEKHHREVLSVGIVQLGMIADSARFPVDSTTGLPGIPDPNPFNDGGSVRSMYGGTLSDVSPGNYEIIVAHGQFFDPNGDWPDDNDPMLEALRVKVYELVPIDE